MAKMVSSKLMLIIREALDSKAVQIIEVCIEFWPFLPIFWYFHQVSSQEVTNYHFFQLCKIKNVIRNIIKDESHMKMLKNDDQNHFGFRCHHPCLPI